MSAEILTLGKMVCRTGAAVTLAFERCGYTLGLLGRTVLSLRHCFAARRTIIDQMYFYGISSVGVTCFFTFFCGMIIAYNTGIVLMEIGMADAIGSIAAVTFCREMAPIMTAIILTARVGSSMTAEIGKMNVSEEIDALRVMGIDPVRFLVMPRVVVLATFTVALTLIADMVGVFGSAIISIYRINVDWRTFVQSAQEALLMKDIFCGMTKAFVFGVTIAIIACAQGLRTRGGARGVGRATMISVVTSLVCVIIFDLIITALFFPKN